METTDYCSYELSKALKECGFDEPCDHYYARRGIIGDKFRLHGAYSIMKHQNSKYSTASAPTLWQAQKWLREKKKIDVLVYNCACGYIWEVSKANNGTGLILFDEKGDNENSGCWTSYEAALSAGIAAALELIKKGE